MKKVINIVYVSKYACGSTEMIEYHAIVPDDYYDVIDGDIIDNFDEMKAFEDVADYIYSGKYTGSVEDHNPNDYYVW